MTPRSPDPLRFAPASRSAQISKATQPRWSKEQIRAARQTALAPLLHARGLDLLEHEAGNFEPAEYPGLLLKENYWRWPAHGLSGNTIDFFTVVLRTSFHSAMLAIVVPSTNPPPPNAS